MVPYVSFLLQPISDALKMFKTSSIDDSALWTSFIGILTRALSYDDNGLQNLSPFAIF